MSRGFVRHSEAQLHAGAVADSRARVALALVHQMILEAAGTQLHLPPERYSPARALDVLYFYRTVERLFSEWAEELRTLPEAPGNQERLIHLSEAAALVPTLPTKRAQVGLSDYLSI